MSEHEQTGDRSAATCRGSLCGWGAGWRLPLLLAVVLIAIVFVNGRGIRQTIPGGDGARLAAPAAGGDDSGEADAAKVAPTNQIVSLAVEFGEGRRREWNRIAWREGMTVGDALSAAAGGENPRDAIAFVQQGTGAAAFLTQLGGVANEGAGQRNWTYRVNGERGDRSFAIYELKPGDQVLWSFDSPR